MKNFWNIFSLSTAILAIGLFITLEYLLTNKIEPIVYDKVIDKIELNLCDEGRILQYYMVSTDYHGGKRAIKNKLLPLIEKDRISFGSDNGNIAVRFVVSCNGEIGLFRAKAIAQNRKKIDFDKTNIEYLISLVSQLDNWNVETKKDKKYDSYYYINFKIRNGLVIDIF